MARRRKQNNALNDFFDLFHDLFLHVPAWLCFPVALLVFVGAELLLNRFAATNPLLQVFAEFGTFISGFLAVLVLLAGGTAAWNKQCRRKLYEKQTSVDSIRNLSWSEFELLIGEAYRRQGYKVTESGGGGADGGVDLRLRGETGEQVIVQCKQWKTYKVGVKEIRELYGILMAERGDRAIFVTSGVYTKEALKFADGKPMKLIDGEQLADLIKPLKASSHLIKATIEPALNETPQCPVCQNTMVRRTARRGPNAGSQFWGCPEYPRCKGTLNLA